MSNLKMWRFKKMRPSIFSFAAIWAKHEKAMYQIFLQLLARKHRWFSGRMLACHAGGPGSIPGRCNHFHNFSFIQNWPCFQHYQLVMLLRGVCSMHFYFQVSLLDLCQKCWKIWFPQDWRAFQEYALSSRTWIPMLIIQGHRFNPPTCHRMNL